MDKIKIVAATGNTRKTKRNKRDIFWIWNNFYERFGYRYWRRWRWPTFEGNALKKATALSKELKLTCIADDTGISIKSLDGFPGVKTKRWLSRNW